MLEKFKQKNDQRNGCESNKQKPLSSQKIHHNFNQDISYSVNYRFYHNIQSQANSITYCISAI